MEGNDTDSATPPAEPAQDAGPRVPRHVRRETAVRDALRALLRDHYEGQYGARPPASGDVELKLTIRASPVEGWQVRFDPPFDLQIEGQLADVQALRAAYRPGVAYCFRCASSSCEHGIPPNTLAVFRGYSSTGVPEWSELVQAFVDAADPRAGSLYDDPPQILAALQMGHELKARQLSSFGRASRTYSILGQVVAGYFRLPSRIARDYGERLALTFQCIETRTERGELRLALNRLAGGIPGEDLDALLATAWHPGLARAVEQASRRVAHLEHRIRAASQGGSSAETSALFRDVPGILRRLARDIESGSRQAGRRTAHAEERRGQQRPVHKAFEEARQASPDSIFYDERRKTVVACGKQNRAHVFNAEGRHVTTFALPADGAAFRVRTGRWRPLHSEEMARFKSRLARAPGEPASGRPEAERSR